MTNILKGNFEKSLFKCENMASRKIFRYLLHSIFFMIILFISNDTVFLVQFEVNLHCEFLKNLLLQINSKLNEKYRMITYNNFMIINNLFFVKYCPPKRMKSNLWQRHGKISNIAR